MKQVVKQYCKDTAVQEINEMIESGWRVHSITAIGPNHRHVLVLFER